MPAIEVSEAITGGVTLLAASWAVFGFYIKQRDKAAQAERELERKHAAAELALERSSRSEREAVRAEIAAGLTNLRGLIEGLGKSMLELREEMHGSIASLREEQMRHRLQLESMEAKYKHMAVLVERKRGQLNSLIAHLQAKGYIGAVNSDSSTTLPIQSRSDSAE